jgi:hypothetical protein
MYLRQCQVKQCFLGRRGADVTNRKNFAARREKVAATVETARRRATKTLDPDSSAVLAAVVDLLGHVEAKTFSSTGMNRLTLPSSSEQKLYVPLRQFFSDHVTDDMVRRISRVQEDGLGTLCDLFYASYDQPEFLKRSDPPLLPEDSDHIRQEVVNVAEYLRHVFDVSEAVKPVRRSARNLNLYFEPREKEKAAAAARTEQTRVPEVYCQLCLHRPSQQHQALNEYTISVAGNGRSRVTLFVLGNRVPAPDKLKPRTTRMSPKYCDSHAGGSSKARTLHKYATRHADDIAAARARPLRTIAPHSDRDRRLIMFLRGQPARLAEELFRLENALRLYRQDIAALLNYYVAAMPIPSAIRERVVVSDRFASLVIESSGSARCLDIDRGEIARFDVDVVVELASWRESFKRLQLLSAYFPGGLRNNDEFWVTRSDPDNANNRVPIANVCFWTTSWATAGVIESTDDILEITVTSPEWLRLMTAGVSHQHPTPSPQRA